jgi:hypothetical protein
MSNGLVVVRISDSETIDTFNHEVLKAVKEVGDGLRQHLAIIETGKVRLRGG